MNFRKINKEEFEKLKRLFPGNEKMWIKYMEMRLQEFDKKEIDVFVIEDNGIFIGEITAEYVSHELENETIPNKRAYLAAFRVDKEYQNQRLGQKLINYCIEDLVEKGYTQFTIGVEDDNENAKHIYFKLGFTDAIDKGAGDEFDPSEYTLYLMDVEKREINKNIEKLIIEGNFGTSVKSLDKVTGGLSHRMYKVVTDKGIYAVKELNQGIMKCEEAYSNFIFSEKVTDIAKANNIPAIGAIKIDNDIMKKVGNSYFMIFNWVDGAILKPNEITEEHCEIIGAILAQIHNIDFSSIENENKAEENLKVFDWNKYLKLAEEKNTKYKELLKENLDLLKQINEKSISGMNYANENLVISHRDLDRKNVMWQGKSPFILDWEASGYVNPTIELISTAYYWAGGETEELDTSKFQVFLNSYKEQLENEIDKNYEILTYADFYSGLNWLEYNFKRSMCIENNYDEEEIKLATNEVIKSINDIRYNLSQIDRIIGILKRNI